tara:strand:- start:281 stop:1498 length:1218 start_codon:yes stop_codon:yes gene_type:complete
MTVRVTKPEFNLREKISELDKPTGLKGLELMRSETPQEARDLIGAGRKNLFINGDMRIDQRSNGSATTPSGTGHTSVDRWKAVINPGSKFSMQKKSDATLLEKAGFPNYMRLTVTTAITSMGSSQYQLFWQTIESKNLFDRTGFGYAGAKDLTLSFWVRSSVAGPFSGALENWQQDRAFVWEVDINNKDTWEYKTVHIPPCTNGTWQTNTANGAYFMFSLGTTIDSEPNIGWVNAQRLGSSTDIRRIGIQGCTVDLSGVQLEIGRVATEFDHHSFAEEFEVCQRYFQTNFPQGVNPQNGYYSATSNLAAGFNGVVCFNGSQARAPWVMFNPKMRSTPTVTLYSASSSDSNGKWAAYKGSWNSGSTNAIDYFGGNGFGVRYNSGGHSFVTGEAYLYRGMWSATAEI